MLNISRKDVYSVYECLKRKSFKAYARKDFNRSIFHISLTAKLASFFNWTYCDEELEELLSKLSEIILSRPLTETRTKGKYVFYDFNARDNCTLTQQYLRAIMSWGGEILYIPENLDAQKSKDIIRELTAYPKAEIYAPDKKLTSVERIRDLYRKIIGFTPEKIFLQLEPWSAEAVVLFQAIHLPEKYYLDITDHAFYIGNKCADYYIEFRNRGCYIATNKRNIPRNKILYQRYYPIISDYPYQGLPEEIEKSKCFILSAGNVYKVGNSRSDYFTILKKVLDRHPEAIFVYISIGRNQVFHEFIQKNKLTKRVFCYPSRKDINEVIKRCNLYFNTYPFSGALLCQYAAVNAKPVVAYNLKERHSDFVETVLCDRDRFKITQCTIDETVQEFSRLITEKEYRRKTGEKLKAHIISPEDFNRELEQLILNHTPVGSIQEECISDQQVFDRYLDLQNTSMLNFYALFFRNLKLFTGMPLKMAKFTLRFGYRYTKFLLLK